MQDSQFTDGSFDYRSLLSTTRNNTSIDNANDAAAASDNGDSCIPALSWNERCIGCATCMVAGYLLGMGSFWRLTDLIRGNPMPFVVNATVGNIIALCGTCFLSGPSVQMRKMAHESRRTATFLYVGSLVLTLMVAFVPLPGPKGLVLVLLMLAQYVAITWYCLSYIPFAQDAVSGFVRRCIQRNSTEY